MLVGGRLPGRLPGRHQGQRADLYGLCRAAQTLVFLCPICWSLSLVREALLPMPNCVLLLPSLEHPGGCKDSMILPVYIFVCSY